MDKKKLIHNYQYSGLPEMIPVGLKHGLKKVLKPSASTDGTVFRSAKWVGKMSEKYASYIQRPGRRIVKSPVIKSSRAYAYMAYKKDMFIESIAKKKYYRFDEMMVILDPYNWAPLTALAVFYTKQPYAVRYTVKGKTKKTDYTAVTKPQQYHRVAILGLYANKNNKVKMELLDADGKTVKERTITIKTPPLSNDIKNIIERKQYTKDSAYNMIMISGGLNIRTCVFDTEGEIRYFLRRKTKAYGIFPLSNGRFLYMEKYVDVPSYSVSQACMMHEMDYLGRVYKTYMHKNGFHHCAREKEPGGNILIGSSCLNGHDENMIVEIDRKTGDIVNELNLNDVFDQTYQNWTDWVHVNAVSYYPEDHSIIVSMRNIHSVAKIDWETKELKWILANPKMWENTSMIEKVLKPQGDVKWNYQQHAAYQLSYNLDGREDTKQMIVYDNHWARRRPVEFYDGDEEFSYLSIYSINEKEMTVAMEHATKVPNSRIRSNAILEYEKGRIFNMAGDLIPDLEGAHGMIEEYDYESDTLLNRFYVKPGFFTAYPFLPDMDTMAEPLGDDYQYLTGTTIPLQKWDKKLDVANAKKLSYQTAAEGEDAISSDDGQDEETMEVAKEKEVYTHFQEDILFVKAQDHTISEIYLIGEKQQYYVDLTTTYQTMDKFAVTVYETPYWLKDLEEDTYHIYYRYKGELYDSEEEFTIQNNMY